MKKPKLLALLAIVVAAMTGLLLHQHRGSIVTMPTAAAPDAVHPVSDFDPTGRVIVRVPGAPRSRTTSHPPISPLVRPTSAVIETSQDVHASPERPARSPAGVAQPILSSQLSTRYNAAPGSKICIEGTSTVHDWQAESRIISGFLEVGPNFPTEPGQSVTPGKVDVQGRAEVTVSSLMSVEKNGQKYSEKMDDKMHEMLKEPFFPKIIFDIRTLALNQSITNEMGDYVFDSTGDLAVAGVTNTIEFSTTMTFFADNKIKLSGSVPLKMSQFKIPPESIVILRTADDLTIKFDWILHRGKSALATNAPDSR